MAPELVETQALFHFGAQPLSNLVHHDTKEVELPSMEDLDALVAELDHIDATLSQLG
jgi:hypothetical protein